MQFPNPRFPTRRCLRILLIALPFSVAWLVGSFVFLDSYRDMAPKWVSHILVHASWAPLFGNLFALVGIMRSRHLDATFGICLHCGYDLRGTPGDRCPECGTSIKQAKTESPPHE